MALLELRLAMMVPTWSKPGGGEGEERGKVRGRERGGERKGCQLFDRGRRGRGRPMERGRKG